MAGRALQWHRRPLRPATWTDGRSHGRLGEACGDRGHQGPGWWVYGNALAHELQQRRRAIPRVECVERRELALDNLIHHLVGACVLPEACKRRRPRAHVHKEASKRPAVDRLVLWVAKDHLGSHCAHMAVPSKQASKCDGFERAARASEAEARRPRRRPNWCAKREGRWVGMAGSYCSAACP